MKLVKRTVIIREKDFNDRLRSEAKHWYTGASWKPLDPEVIEKENVVSILRHGKPYWDLSNGWADALDQLRWSLYNNRYIGWNVWEENGEIWICPTNHNGKSSRLGIATLEYCG